MITVLFFNLLDIAIVKTEDKWMDSEIVKKMDG